MQSSVNINCTAEVNVPKGPKFQVLTQPVVPYLPTGADFALENQWLGSGVDGWVA